LAGNPNSGKTTLFNALTGLNQHVGNWPGVTVEKKEGRLKPNLKPGEAAGDDVVIVDLPGVYSLSPHSPEEVVADRYLADERPDVIINIVDATNLERNLYLTGQLAELGLPMIIAVNMMDVARARGDKLETEKLALELGCTVAEMSAITGEGVQNAVSRAHSAAQDKNADGKKLPAPPRFGLDIEQSLTRICDAAGLNDLPKHKRRRAAVRLFERNAAATRELRLVPDKQAKIEEIIKNCETAMDDDSESLITASRYARIEEIVGKCWVPAGRGRLSVSDRIDRVVTNRWLALPIFALVIFFVYYVSITSLGALATDWANDGVFGEGWHLAGIGTSQYELAVENFNPESGGEKPEPADYGIWVPGIPVLLGDMLKALNCAEWLQGLVIDGITAGVGAVLGFVPQMLILFLFLAFMESCGYMARVAFIMDRLFRRFGLSGKSFIPLLVGTGCGVPGVMASRTIESERERRITVMTTTFIPCSAKLPILALIAGALFDGAWWVAPSAYFVGVASIVCSGVILKKTRLFAGDITPFVMELPAYHWPTAGALLRSMWERGWSFIKKAGTIILLATVFVWFTSHFGWSEDGFGMVEMTESILAVAGSSISWIFAPLGWGSWQATVAAITGLIAKENVVGTFGVLFGFAEVTEDGQEVWSALGAHFTALGAYSFLMFNMLCAPCFAAMGAIKREMNSVGWFWTAIGYQCGFAYVASLCFYQFGLVFSSGRLVPGTVIAAAALGLFLWLLFRPVKTAGGLASSAQSA
jgi:ferrous iron transport protein B